MVVKIMQHCSTTDIQITGFSDTTSKIQATKEKKLKSASNHKKKKVKTTHRIAKIPANQISR